MKKVKNKFKVGLKRFAKYKSRKHTGGPKPHAESAESADPHSPDATRTSTTASPPQSPLPFSTPIVPVTPRTDQDEPKSTEKTQLTSSRKPTQGAAPLTATCLDPVPVVQTATTSTTIHQPASVNWNETDTIVGTIDSDPDNIDEIFEDAWNPADGLALADGAPIPWLRGKASPSAAAKYLDDIQEGRG